MLIGGTQKRVLRNAKSIQGAFQERRERFDRLQDSWDQECYGMMGTLSSMEVDLQGCSSVD